MTSITNTIFIRSNISKKMHNAIKFDVCMNRRNVTINNSLQTNIFLLFHVMNDRVAKILFDRATCFQRRIDMRDELYEIISQNANVDQNLIFLLNEKKLKQIMNHFVSIFLINLQNTIYICQNESIRLLFDQFKNY